MSGFFSIGRLFIWLFIVSPSGESGGENTKYLIEGDEMKFKIPESVNMPNVTQNHIDNSEYYMV